MSARPRYGGPLLLCALLLLGAGAGCLSGPKFVKPVVPLNAHWNEHNDPRLATHAPLDVEWWKAFNDPALVKLVELAYAENLPLQVAGLRILEARAQLGIAVWQQTPEGGPTASATAIGLSEHAANSANLDRYYGDYQVGFDATWEIDFWRKFRRGVKAENATYFSMVADYDFGLVALAAEVARTYTLIRTSEAQIALTTDNIAVQEEGLKLAESRYRNGATSELDVAQAATLLENTRSSLPELRLDLRQAHNALCTLLGQPTGCAQPLLASGSGIPQAPQQAAVSVPAEMLQRRPDIRAAELRAYSQCERIGIAKTDFYPRVVLSGSVGTQSSSGGGTLSDNSSFLNLFGVGSLFYAVGVRIFWPILNSGRILNNVRVQDARFQQALIDYRNTVLRAAQEVDDGIAGFLREQEAVVFAGRSVSAAKTAVNLAMVQYREGAIDYQRVLDTQRVLLQAQNNETRLRSAVTTNLIALYKALGGGWEHQQDRPFVPDVVRAEMQKRTNWGRYFTTTPPPPKHTGAAQTRR
jgi:NodT family efflux transporter outer membrane factor (OMF) lipoprotein